MVKGKKNLSSIFIPSMARWSGEIRNWQTGVVYSLILATSVAILMSTSLALSPSLGQYHEEVRPAARAANHLHKLARGCCEIQANVHSLAKLVNANFKKINPHNRK